MEIHQTGVNLSPDDRVGIKKAVFCLINQGTRHMELIVKLKK